MKRTPQAKERRSYPLGLKNIIWVAISAPVSLLILFITALPLARIVSSILCPSLGGLCSLDEHGLTFLFIGGAICATLTGTLLLHYLAKLSWLVSFCVTIASFSTLLLYFSVVSGIWQSDLSPLVPIIVQPIVLAILYLLYSLLFVRLSKWPLVCISIAICLASVNTLLMPQLLSYSIETAHQAHEDKKDLDDAKALPFQVHAPSYLPTDYVLVGVNAYAAHLDSPQLYSMTYGVGSSPARNIYIDQVLFSGYMPPEVCDSKLAGHRGALGECKKIGHTVNCDVYDQFPSIDGESVRYFCMLGNTHITLTVHEGEIPAEEIIRIFSSMWPAEVQNLQQESIRNKSRN